MSATRREQVFAALFAVLSTVVGVTAKRNETVPDRLDQGAGPLLVQRDGGDPPEPTTVLLSPVAYVYDETVAVELALQAGSGREEAMDALVAAVGAALSLDRTLGGACDDCRVLRPPRMIDDAPAGAAPIRFASLPVRLSYTTTDPLA